MFWAALVPCGQTGQAGLAQQQYGTIATTWAHNNEGTQCGTPGRSSLGLYDSLFGMGGGDVYCHDSGASASFCDHECPAPPGKCHSRCVSCRDITDKAGDITDMRAQTPHASTRTCTCTCEHMHMHMHLLTCMCTSHGIHTCVTCALCKLVDQCVGCYCRIGRHADVTVTQECLRVCFADDPQRTFDE